MGEGSPIVPPVPISISTTAHQSTQPLRVLAVAGAGGLSAYVAACGGSNKNTQQASPASNAASSLEAARTCGATDTRIMLRRILPYVIATMIVIFSISIDLYILAEAGLSFLGLGPADQTTWGKMVTVGRNVLDRHPWESLFSGAAITLAVLAFNLAGDAIRDELDPRLRDR